MTTERLIPCAKHLVESTRSVGYSFESAIADIIDNSISKDASTINILFDSNTPQYVAIVDDGTGRRLDDQPLLFLSLRGIDVSRFASNMLRQEVERIWASSDRRPSPGRTLDEKEAASLFGFEHFDEEIDVKAVIDNLRVDVLKADKDL